MTVKYLEFEGSGLEERVCAVSQAIGKANLINIETIYIGLTRVIRVWYWG